MASDLLRVTSKGFEYLEDLRDKEDRYHTQTGWMHLPSDTNDHWDKYVLEEMETLGRGRWRPPRRRRSERLERREDYPYYEREEGETSIRYLTGGVGSDDPQLDQEWKDQVRSAMRRLFEAGHIDNA